MAIDEVVPEPGPFEPDLTKWDAWRPEEVARRLGGVAAPWCVAGGWAIDLFLGYQHREHEDIEIGVPHDRFEEVAAALAGFQFFVVGDGLAWPLADARDAFAEHHQTWGREPATGRWRLDIFREPTVGGAWIYRRDARIRLPTESPALEIFGVGIHFCSTRGDQSREMRRSTDFTV